jgi:uncharacterized protein (DUF1499 family)
MRIIGGLVQILIFLLLIGGSLLAAGIMSNRLPLTDPPGLVRRLSTYLNTNVAETSEDSPFAELRPRRYEAPEGLLFDLARRAVQSLKWEIASLDAEKKEIQAVVTTKIWKFKDDVTVQVRPAQPSGSVLWIRSASRVGKGDLGANTRHVMDLVEAVNSIAPVQTLAPQQGSPEEQGLRTE